jgi:hypothetical protein
MKAALPPRCAERLCLSVRRLFFILRGYASQAVRRSLTLEKSGASRKGGAFPHIRAAEPQTKTHLLTRRRYRLVENLKRYVNVLAREDERGRPAYGVEAGAENYQAALEAGGLDAVA